MVNDNKKINFVQYLRIVACIAVIIIHVSGDRLNESTGLYWWIQNIFNNIFRWAVPIFFMITGVTFLTKDISIEKLYKKYILRICIIYAFWSVLYTLIFTDFSNFSIIKLIEDFIKGYYHLWFLYALIGLYIIIPLLKKIIEDRIITKYFLVLWFVIGSIFFSLGQIPSLRNIYIVIQERLSLFFILGYSGYCILGYYIYQYNISYKKRILIYIFGILGAIVTVLAAQINQEGNTPICENMLPSVVIMAIAIFTFFRNSMTLNRSYKYLLKIATLTLGIYLIHPMIFRVIKNFGINTTVINPIIMIPILVVLIFFISVFITMILKKMKITNKII